MDRDVSVRHDNNGGSYINAATYVAPAAAAPRAHPSSPYVNMRGGAGASPSPHPSHPSANPAHPSAHPSHPSSHAQAAAPALVRSKPTKPPPVYLKYKAFPLKRVTGDIPFLLR